MTDPADVIAARPTEAPPAAPDATRRALRLVVADEVAMATHERALLAFREAAEQKAAAAKLGAERAREEWNRVAAAAGDGLTEIGQVARSAVTVVAADLLHCPGCGLAAHEWPEQQIHREPQQTTPPLDDQPDSHVSRRIFCSAKCAETHAARITDDMTRTAAAVEAALEAAEVGADDAEHEAAEAEALAGLARLDRAAIRDNVDATFRASVEAAEAERAAEAVAQQAAKAEKKAAIEAVTEAATEAFRVASEADFEAGVALGERQRARRGADRAHMQARRAWTGLQECERDARMEGRPWPPRHCESCQLPLENPFEQFCTAACKRAGASDDGLATGALRCAWCRRLFVVAPAVVWPEDEAPVCSASCLRALPVDMDAWQHFAAWPEVRFTGPAPSTPAARRAWGAKLAAESRRWTTPRTTSSTTEPAPSPPPAPPPEGTPRPHRASAGGAHQAPGRGGRTPR